MLSCWDLVEIYAILSNPLGILIDMIHKDTLQVDSMNKTWVQK
jgi:hypothetical protein